MKNVVTISVASGIAGLAALALGFYAGTARTPAPVASAVVPETVAAVQQPSAPQALDKTAVEQIVRNYLIEHPEVMIEVQNALETKQASAAKSRVQDVIASSGDELLASPHDAVFGNPNGDVTIVEFFDYNCGYCKRALPDMEAILKNDPNVRFVMKEFPILGPDSIRAHVVAQAFKSLHPDKYRELHIALMSSPERSTEASVIAAAVKLGADEAQLREKIKDPAITTSFQGAYKLANELDITGTPSYVIGNDLVPGAIGLEGLVERIAAARAKKG